MTANDTVPRPEVGADGSFRIDDIRFRLEVRPPPRTKSTTRDFTLVKAPEFLATYADLADRFRPRTVLELGIFEGGSFVLLDKMFRPDRIAALDIITEKVEPLEDYCAGLPHRSAHYGISQTDVEAVHGLVDGPLGGTLDLVVDDASHHYDKTRVSFVALFPRLSPGGYYVIEDWAWAHWPGYQSPDNGWANAPALTNLLFETVAALGSGSGGIAEIRVHRGLYIVRKGADAGRGDPFAGTRMRGRTLQPI